MNKYGDFKNGHGKPCCYCCRIMIKAGTDDSYENPELVCSIEHKIYPKSKGGNNHPENLDIACKRCNNLRSNIAIELFEPFARVILQRFPNAPTPVLREALRNFIYHVAELSLKNKSGIKAATLATLIQIDDQMSNRDLSRYINKINSKGLKTDAGKPKNSKRNTV